MSLTSISSAVFVFRLRALLAGYTVFFLSLFEPPSGWYALSLSNQLGDCLPETVLLVPCCARVLDRLLVHILEKLDLESP